MSLHQFLFIAAAICFFIAIFPVPARFNLIAAGLLFVTLTHLA